MRKPVRFYGADLSHVNLGKSRSSGYKPNDLSGQVSGEKASVLSRQSFSGL